MRIENLIITPGECLGLTAELKQSSAILFRPDIQVQVFAAGSPEVVYGCTLSAADYTIAWLPRR